MRLPFVLPGLLVLCAVAPPAGAQQRPGAPGVVTQGSQDTMIGGKPAARVGDGTSAGGPIVEGSSNVFINGKPAAQSGSLTTGCAK
jgi:uncharacterized Zn-binding protein involved in type VI secretion